MTTSSARHARAVSAYDRTNRRLNLGMRSLGLWVALVSLFFLWQALDYRGIVGWLAEQQFFYFDRYWPTLTFAALTALCTAPFAILIWVLRRGQRRAERHGREIDFRRKVLGHQHRLQHFFTGVATGCVIAALISIVMMLQLPNDRLMARSVVLGSTDAIAPPDGRTVLTGWVDLSQTSQFNENLLLVKRTLYFAPIRTGPDDRSPIRYFVEVRRDDLRDAFHHIDFPRNDRGTRVHVWRYRVKNLAFTPYVDGVLRRHALPGEIVNLYRFVGFKVPQDHYVLFRSNEPIEWRFEVVAGEFAVAAVIAALIAGFFAWRRRVVVRKTLAPRDYLKAELPTVEGGEAVA